MTTKDWTELRAWAAEILEKQGRGIPIERREALVVMVDTECRRACLNLPPCAGCAGCEWHITDAPDGCPECAAEECVYARRDQD